MTRTRTIPGSAAFRSRFGVPRVSSSARVVTVISLVTAAIALHTSQCIPGPLPALPPLEQFVDEAWRRSDFISFESVSQRWERVEVDAVQPVSGRFDLFEKWSWWVAEDGFRDRAEDRAGGWLRLGELDIGDRRIRASKELGGRIRISSFTGYQASSQRMVRVDYGLRPKLVLRSEARERGESRIVVEREWIFR